jgi:hypothetical protein
VGLEPGVGTRVGMNPKNGLQKDRSACLDRYVRLGWVADCTRRDSKIEYRVCSKTAAAGFTDRGFLCCTTLQHLVQLKEYGVKQGIDSDSRKPWLINPSLNVADFGPMCKLHQ